MRDRRRHRTGQVFLVNKRIAEIEAEHAAGKTVLEIGPGPGILTAALLRKAKKVIAVEKDKHLAELLISRIRSKKLRLINKDFLDTSDEEIGAGSIDIVVSNIPYSISSRVIEWLAEHQIGAVLCLQKEFVDHMLAREGTPNYSRLSVMTTLSFRITKILDVPRTQFRPVPLVDSSIVYMKPLGRRVAGPAADVLRALMQHKKKTVRNAMLDSAGQFGRSCAEISAIMAGIALCNERPFKLSPESLLSIASEIAAAMGKAAGAAQNE
ncbi:MAG: 16S rRNA (adenine(1518)-N(6)/adenine(1519)-N(6))-dimethyltransferase RsmA [Candidatus Micrarchaeaceae archaeon]